MLQVTDFDAVSSRERILGSGSNLLYMTPKLNDQFVHMPHLRFRVSGLFAGPDVSETLSTSEVLRHSVIASQETEGGSIWMFTFV